MTQDDPAAHPSWPPHLSRTGAVRFSRSSEHYDDTVAFYRDVVGLPVIGEFTGSFGEDGTILGLPDSSTHLEIVRGRGGPREVDPLDQLVLYLSGTEALAEAGARLRSAAAPEDPAQHPYWSARGAVTFLDPDGRRLVFAPWVFGREEEPGRPASAGVAPAPSGAAGPVT